MTPDPNQAIEYNQRRLREHIVQAMPIVDNRLSEVRG